MAPSAVDRSPEIVVKEFYKWYIHSINPYKKATNSLRGGKGNSEEVRYPEVYSDQTTVSLNRALLSEKQRCRKRQCAFFVCSCSC